MKTYVINVAQACLGELVHLIELNEVWRVSCTTTWHDEGACQCENYNKGVTS